MNPILALIIANIIWGAAAPIFKFALGNIPPFTLAFIRFFFASLLFIPFILRFNWRVLTIRDWLRILLAGFFGITINISFFFLGLEKGTSINAPIIASAGPVFIFIGAVIFLREKVQKKVLIGMLTALLGVIFIVFQPLITNGKTPQDISIFAGNIFFVVAALGAVMDPLIIKNVLKKVSPFVALFINFLFSSLTFLPFAFIESRSWSFSQLNSAGLTGIIFGVIFSSALAYFLYYYGISKINVQEVGLFMYVDPIIAVLIAIPLLHEFPNLYFLLGSLMVFSGIFIAEGRIHYHPIHKLRKVQKVLVPNPEVVK